MVCKKEKEKEKEKKNLRARKTTVFKKAKELSILCDVDVLLIMYDDDGDFPQPQVCCSDPNAVHQIISRYFTHRKKAVTDSKKAVMGSKVDDDSGFIDVLAGKIEHVNHRINLIKENAALPFIIDDYCDQSFDLYDLEGGTFSSLLGFDDGFKCQDPVGCAGMNSSDQGLLGFEGFNSQNRVECGTMMNSSSNESLLGFEGFKWENTDEFGVNDLCDDTENFQSLLGLFDDGFHCQNNNAESGMESAAAADVQRSSMGLQQVDDDLHNLLMQFAVDDFEQDEVIGFQGFNAQSSIPAV